MTIESWMFSAKRAWQNSWVKVVTISTAFFVLLGSAWFMMQMFFLHRLTGGSLVLHYNIYLGIDTIAAWGWAMMIPVVWILFTLVDFLWAFGVYRQDVYQAWAFLIIAALWSIPWMMTLWHLVVINR